MLPAASRITLSYAMTEADSSITFLQDSSQLPLLCALDTQRQAWSWTCSQPRAGLPPGAVLHSLHSWQHS